MNSNHPKRIIFKLIVLICLVMLVPILPFVFLGESFESQMEGWLKSQHGSSQIFWLTVFLLAVDIFLPIPSSGLCTFAGGMLGVWWGSVAGFLGLSLGCLIGFSIARLFGAMVVRKYTTPEDYMILARYASDYGMPVVAFTRALPILAEATVLVMGAGKLSWSRFLFSMLMSNLVLSILYSSIGAFFKDADSLPWAIAASVILPLILTFFARGLFRHYIKNENDLQK